MNSNKIKPLSKLRRRNIHFTLKSIFYFIVLNMMNQFPENPKQDTEVNEETSIGLACKVILYNDDWHSFDEVINQLIKAINCTFEIARSLTFEVHVKGKALVFTGDMKDCLRVSSILEEIALNTEIVS